MPRRILVSLPVGFDKEAIPDGDELDAQEVQQAIARLSPREQRVIRERYFNQDKKSSFFATIGRREGVSGERIRQVEQRAKQRLRALLNRDSSTTSRLP
jgi:DNA-directed RNA polymerase sigma subunit (sigma70/sigma32)